MTKRHMAAQHMASRHRARSAARPSWTTWAETLAGEVARKTRELAALLPVMLAIMAPLLGAGVAKAFDVTEVEASVYKIYAFPADKKGYGFGSGFLVSGKRTVITNYHVVNNNVRFRIAFRDANRQGRLVEARLTTTRPHLDIAILEADQDLPGKPLTLGDYEPEKLANVVTMGFPGAAEIRNPTQVRTEQEFETLLKDPANLDATMTSGAVSRMNTADNRSWQARTVQHNAQFSPGNSGGPLFDECNAVIGINTFLSKDAQGVFFSIHSGELIRTLRETSISFQSISHCSPVSATSYTMPIIVVMSATLAAAALVLAMRAGTLQQVGSQISRLSRARRPDVPAGNVMGSVSLAGSTSAVGGNIASLQPITGGRSIQLEGGRALILGRARISDIPVENDTVSSRHATVEFNSRTNRLVITDLGSSNGTAINGSTITTSQAKPGDVIRFGKAEFKFQGAAGAPAASPSAGSGTVTARGWMLSGFDPSGRAVQLEMRPQSGETTRTWIVGRDKARSQLVIDDSSVSGAHAEIGFVAGQGLTLRDLGSTNGTQVDGQGIGSRVVNLKETGQEVMFGAAKLRLSRLT